MNPFGKRFTSGFIIGGLIFAAIAWFAEKKINPPISFRGAVIRQSSVDYKFIVPLLACDIGSEETFPELAPLKAKLTYLVNQDIRNGQAQNISVYFRALKSSRWIDINKDTMYTPASLLKVFVMMAYYKEADDANKPNVLQQQVFFQGTSTPAIDVDGNIIPHLARYKFYTVDKLIKQMIIYSDNEAAITLIDNFSSKTWDAFNVIFSDLQIPSPTKHSKDTILAMPVGKYSMVFRTLFSATYLGREYSEKALHLLSETTFNNAIVAGVPSGTIVAHKYGDAIVPATQLHDCGIVYYPNHPYLLCVMASGKNFASLEKIIKDISSETYKQARILFAA